LPFLPQSLRAEYATFLKTVSCLSPQQAAGYSLKINQYQFEERNGIRPESIWSWFQVPTFFYVSLSKFPLLVFHPDLGRTDYRQPQHRRCIRGDLPGRLTPWGNHNNCSLLRGLGCTCHLLCRVFRAYADSAGIIRNVLCGIFSVAVYNYAAIGRAGKLFNEDLIRNAFNEKRDTI
jgi:hypothetical protein